MFELLENEFMLIIKYGYGKMKAYQMGGEPGEIFFNAQRCCCC